MLLGGGAARVHRGSPADTAMRLWMPMVLRANAAAVLTTPTLMPALIVLLRSSSVCSSDEKRKMCARGRIPACTVELGGDADCEGD